MKYNFNSGWTFKKYLFLFFFLLPVWILNAQPMNGNYTVGGSAPDFATLQLAADALTANGVSGSVFFNIRPGTYSKNGGNNSVLLLDSTVAGLSENNRITFQPDAASGGNVDNVILEKNITDPGTSDGSLVSVILDYITFRDITFRENDNSLYTFNNFLVKLGSTNLFKPSSIVIEACKFEGSDSSITNTGIAIDYWLKDITIRENTFTKLLVGISAEVLDGNNIVEDNQFLAGWHSSTGAGDPLGSAIRIGGQNLVIRRNIVDFNGSPNGGYTGINVLIQGNTESVFIEQNLIMGTVSQAIKIPGNENQTAPIVIANNMINTSAFPVWANEGAFGMYVTAGNASIVFNTIAIGGSNFNGLIVLGNNCSVFNNIITAKSSQSFCWAYNLGYSSQSLNLQSDYNSIYFQTGIWNNWLVYSDGVSYYTLSEYQNATGLDTNSTSKDVEFVAPDDLHLTECQSQDPELWGIPIAGITIDIDDEIRHETLPTIGADENKARSNDMFGDPFIAELPGTAFSIASAKFDNLLADGLAVPDWDNNQVLLYHYNGDKTFSQTGTIQTPYPPTQVKFFDLDQDAHLDLIVGLDASTLQIWWGDGAGGFPTNTLLNIPGEVQSIEIGNDNFFQEPQVFLTIKEAELLPDYSFMAYIADDNGRENVEVVLLKNPGTSVPDTIYSVMDDMAIANIDTEPNEEIVALTIGIPSPVYIFNDTTVSGNHLPYSTHYRYVFGNTYSYTPSSISINDFDGDGDNDILTTGYSWDELVLIKNLGNYTFADEEIIARQTRGFVVMDYENDGDNDIITVNERLEENGITVYLNDGVGNFTVRENCYFPYADGKPWSIISSDFDQDGRTDIAVTSTSDSLYVLYNLGGGTVGVQDQEIIEMPTSFSLLQNFPNPFNPTTTIRFEISEDSRVTLQIFNILGEEVSTLVNTELKAGQHDYQFNAYSLASGIYFYRLQAGSFVETKKMILIR